MNLQNQFKCRASAMGALLSRGRSKSEDFGATALGVVQSWVLNEAFGRSGGFRSKYTDKGISEENASITLAAKVLDWFDAQKNDEWFEDDHFTGTPDIILPGEVIDIKSPWGLSSFPFFATECPEKNYFAQLQVYMALTGKPRASLVYVLTDAPEFLIEREAFSRAREQGLQDCPIELYEEVKAELTFSDIPDHLRVKAFTFDYDADLVESYRERVEAARLFVPELVIILNHK